MRNDRPSIQLRMSTAAVASQIDSVEMYHSARIVSASWLAETMRGKLKVQPCSLRRLIAPGRLPTPHAREQTPAAARQPTAVTRS